MHAADRMTSDPERWLLELGGAAIRFRTATELLPGSADEQNLAADLVRSPLVQTWLARVEPNFAFNALHGSKPTCFENALGKLTQLGCRAGMPELDQRVAPFLAWLQETVPDGEVSSSFADAVYRLPIVAAFLARAGYGAHPAVAAVARQRLDALYDFCRRGDYDIYVDPAGFPTLSDAYRRHRLVDPALYPDGRLQLPHLYDLHLFAALPDEAHDPDTRRKLDVIVDYVLDPEYQRLPEGYGIALMDGRRYWVIGWSVHLPGYFHVDAESREGKRAAKRLVRMAILMAHFPAARRHRWLHDAYVRLDSFRTEQGAHRFPAHYLHEGRSGYWLMGSYMGLEENRRRAIARELESTFWMRKLASLMGGELP